MGTDLLSRFLSRVDRSGGPDACWPWLGSKSDRGYGLFWMGNRKRQKAHRFSFAHFVGEIQAGKIVCHKCDNPACVNPQHLFLSDWKGNVHDMLRKGRMNKRERRLSGREIAELRKLHKSGKYTYLTLARMTGFKVSSGYLAKVLR